MKKIFFLSLLLSFPFLGAARPYPAFALTATPSSALNLEIAAPLLLPDSPFYFLKTLLESVSLFFAFSPSRKLSLHLSLSEKRLAEALALARKDKPDLVAKLLGGISSHLETALSLCQGLVADEQPWASWWLRLKNQLGRQEVFLGEIDQGLGQESQLGSVLEKSVRKKLEDLALEVERRWSEAKPSSPSFINPLGSPSAGEY